LSRIRKAIGTYFWTALYQQRPSPAEGDYFKRQWFDVVRPDRIPRDLRTVRCWDLAATTAAEGSDPDWLVGCKIGVDEAQGKYYVIDVRRERLSPEGVQKIILQTAAIDGPETAIRIEQEGAASGKIVAHYYTRLLDGYDARFTTIPRSSKFTRSGPFNAACERGDVFLMAGDWVQTFLDELAAFPTGSHDDQVDSAVGAYTALSSDPREWTRDDWGTVLDGTSRTPKTPRQILLDRVRGKSAPQFR
jgi:predicted phage terminase large subunit-like protein